jgi:hypothetical protein
VSHISGNQNDLQASALARWVRALALSFARATESRGMTHGEFEQIAQGLSLTSPEFYGVLTGAHPSAEPPEIRLAAEFELSPQLARRLRAYLSAKIRASLPIGPSCC